MKVKQLLEFLQEFTKDKRNLEKEVTFYNYLENRAYYTSDKVEVVDLSDDEYLDFVFNS